MSEVQLVYPMIPKSFIKSLPEQELYVNLTDISTASCDESVRAGWSPAVLDYLETQVILITAELRLRAMQSSQQQPPGAEEEDKDSGEEYAYGDTKAPPKMEAPTATFVARSSSRKSASSKPKTRRKGSTGILDRKVFLQASIAAENASSRANIASLSSSSFSSVVSGVRSHEQQQQEPIAVQPVAKLWAQRSAVRVGQAPFRPSSAAVSRGRPATLPPRPSTAQASPAAIARQRARQEAAQRSRQESKASAALRKANLKRRQREEREATATAAAPIQHKEPTQTQPQVPVPTTEESIGNQQPRKDHEISPQTQEEEEEEEEEDWESEPDSPREEVTQEQQQHQPQKQLQEPLQQQQQQEQQQQQQEQQQNSDETDETPVSTASSDPPQQDMHLLVSDMPRQQQQQQQRQDEHEGDRSSHEEEEEREEEEEEEEEREEEEEEEEERLRVPVSAARVRSPVAANIEQLRARYKQAAQEQQREAARILQQHREQQEQREQREAEAKRATEELAEVEENKEMQQLRLRKLVRAMRRDARYIFAAYWDESLATPSVLRQLLAQKHFLEVFASRHARSTLPADCLMLLVTDEREEVFDIVSRACAAQKRPWQQYLPKQQLRSYPTAPYLWNLLWTWKLPRVDFSALLSWQRVNHFPDSRALTRKDLLKQHLTRFSSKRGFRFAGLFDVMPRTFVLPGEFLSFLEAFTERSIALGKRHYWIVKPVSNSRGRGIRLVNDITSVPRKAHSVVQEYIPNPLLLKGFKFDLRLYVLVTSVQPLEAFLYQAGFARFCTKKFSLRGGDMSDKLVHLTNSSIQHSHASEEKDPERLPFATAEGGSKVSLTALARLLREHEGIDFFGAVWPSIEEMVLRSLAAVEMTIHPHVNSFELFGYDVLVDERLKPWLIEVNSSPSLEQLYALDEKVKPALLRDIVALVDPLPVNRAVLLAALEQRLKTGQWQDLGPLLDAVLGGCVPRGYGEPPAHLGDFRCIAPSPAYRKLLRQLATFDQAHAINADHYETHMRALNEQT